MTYRFHAWNEGDYAHIEAYSSPTKPVHTLKVPMQTLYTEEVSYILNTEDWSDESEDFQHYWEADWNEFSAGDTPKLVSWWLSMLPETMKRKRSRTWKHRALRRLRNLLSKYSV